MNSGYDDDENDWFEEEGWLDDEDSDTVTEVVVLVKMRYKVSFYEPIVSKAQVKELLINQDYEDILDESLIQIMEVIEI